MVPTVRLGLVALGRRNHWREVHVPCDDVQHRAADARRGPPVSIVPQHAVGRVLVADAPQRTAVHVTGLWPAREQVGAPSERAIRPPVQQERPAQLVTPVAGKWPIREHADGAVVHGHQSDHVDQPARGPKLTEQSSHVVHGSLLRPHGHEVALPRHVQKPRVQPVFSQEREHAVRLRVRRQRRVRQDHFGALHRSSECVCGRRVEVGQAQICGASVEVRARDICQTVVQVGCRIAAVEVMRVHIHRRRPTERRRRVQNKQETRQHARSDPRRERPNPSQQN